MPSMASIIDGNNAMAGYSRMCRANCLINCHSKNSNCNRGRLTKCQVVDSARSLDTKENHKVVVKEEGKPDQKYMSLTEPLWTKSFDSRKSDLSHREQSGNQLCLGDHSNPTNNFPLTSSNQSWPSWTSGKSSKDLPPADSTFEFNMEVSISFGSFLPYYLSDDYSL